MFDMLIVFKKASVLIPVFNFFTTYYYVVQCVYNETL